jgi:hypothetical protein
MKPAFLLLLAFLGGPALAQERPSDYPYSAPLVAEAPASHYRFSMPAAVYRGAARRDLGDVRIFNAAGEPVPYAFAPRQAQPAVPALRGVNLFPLYGTAEKSLDAATVHVERSSRGTIVRVSLAPGQGKEAAGARAPLGYLADASELKAVTEALVFSWDAPEAFSGQARIEASDDLRQWSTLAANAPVLFLEHAGARLERKRVEVPATRAKYLRISFSGVPRTFLLKEVRAELRADKPELAREWLSLEGKEGKAPGELFFDAAGNFPVDRLRLVLPQINTVAEVQLLTRERAEDPWRPAAFATAYRLGREGGEVVSPEIALPANNDRYWRLKVDQKGGGFGAGPVKLELGWPPHEVLFAARGSGPFSLAYGSKTASPGALPIIAVLPRYGDGWAAETKLARVGEVSDSSRPAATLLSDPARFLRGLSAHREAKKWLLWAVLLAGVLLLGWMAFRLMNDLGKRER